MNNTNTSETKTIVGPEFGAQQNADTRLPPLQPQRQVQQEEIEHEEPKGKGCMGCGCGCRTIACGGCLFIVALIIGFVFLLVNKPAFFWRPFVDFMNNGVQVPTSQNETPDKAKTEINDQIKNVGENKVTITESQLTALVHERIPDLQDAAVDIEPEFIRIYWALDKTVPDDKLYGFVEIKYDGTKMSFSQIGTGRISIPEALTDTVTQFIFSKLTNVQGGDSNFQILNNFLAPDSNVKLSNLELKKDQLTITIKVSADLLK